MLAGVRNPNGAPINVTYFLSLEGCARDDTTEAEVVLDRIAAGDEMAVHTVTHTTSDTTDFFTWRQEMTGVLAYLDRLGVPRQQRGFRAPFVATNAAMFDVLETLGFLYDSSIYESPFFSPVSNGVGQFAWPYTLDYGPAQNCASWAAFNRCTDDPKPGLMVHSGLLPRRRAQRWGEPRRLLWHVRRGQPDVLVQPEDHRRRPLSRAGGQLHRSL